MTILPYSPRKFRWIFRTEFTALVVVVDLPKELSAAQVEGTEVMLTVRIVIRGELFELSDLLERRGLHHGRKSVDA